MKKFAFLKIVLLLLHRIALKQNILNLYVDFRLIDMVTCKAFNKNVSKNAFEKSVKEKKA